MKVWAKDETVRQSLVHPSGARFGPSLAEPAYWPDDKFTQRRLVDGDVLDSLPANRKSPPVRQMVINPPKPHAPTVAKTG